MEKLSWLVWKNEGQEHDAFRDQLLAEVAPSLLEMGAQKLRICAVDSAVAPAEPYRIVAQPVAYDGYISFWVDSATQAQPFIDLLQGACGSAHGYVVTESEPLVNREHVAPAGERTFGMNEVVALQKPERLSREEWLDTWFNSHTQIAIDTQSTFGYRQNLVARPITEGAPPIDAMIEENFPEAAISSREAFYDAEGNPELKAEREQAMVESVMRFIDFDKIDCIPMSEFDFSG